MALLYPQKGTETVDHPSAPVSYTCHTLKFENWNGLLHMDVCCVPFVSSPGPSPDLNGFSAGDRLSDGLMRPSIGQCVSKHSELSDWCLW